MYTQRRAHLPTQRRAEYSSARVHFRHRSRARVAGGNRKACRRQAWAGTRKVPSQRPEDGRSADKATRGGSEYPAVGAAGAGTGPRRPRLFQAAARSRRGARPCPARARSQSRWSAWRSTPRRARATSHVRRYLPPRWATRAGGSPLARGAQRTGAQGSARQALLRREEEGEMAAADDASGIMGGVVRLLM